MRRAAEASEAGTRCGKEARLGKRAQYGKAVHELRVQSSVHLDAAGRRTRAAVRTQGMRRRALLPRPRLAEVERCCLELIEHDDRHFDALHLLGVVCLDRAQLADAVGYLTRAARERPNDRAGDTIILAPHCSGLKLYDQAEPCCGVRLRCGRAMLGALNNLGNALPAVGDTTRRSHAIGRCWHSSPDHVPARYNIGRSLAALDRLEEAVVSFRDGAGDAPADTDADRLADVHAGLGEALVGLGRYDDALAICRAIAGLQARGGGVERKSGPAAARPVRRGLAKIRRPLGRRRP